MLIVLVVGVGADGGTGTTAVELERSLVLLFQPDVFSMAPVKEEVVGPLVAAVVVEVAVLWDPP